ncbi:hypothetical protein AURDEDRAFT_163663 [Auricularia subglabra TFB-10046 SS5]|nr:hypothetical protein AURDEDRAFT_163663 [Auricularia subglabra TFB-10046 SS5]
MNSPRLPPPPSSAGPAPSPSSPIAQLGIGRPRRAAAVASLRTNGLAVGLLLFARVVIAELNVWGWTIALRGTLYWIWLSALVLAGCNMLFSAYALRSPKKNLPPLLQPSKVTPRTASPARPLAGISKATPRRTSFAPPAPSPLSTPARLPNFTLSQSSSAFNLAASQPTPGSASAVNFMLNSVASTGSMSSSPGDASPLAYRLAARASTTGRTSPRP